MRPVDLPSPGSIPNAILLRKELAKSLSFVQSQCRRRYSLPDQLVSLRATLQAGVKFLDELEEAGPAERPPEPAVDEVKDEAPTE